MRTSRTEVQWVENFETYIKVCLLRKKDYLKLFCSLCLPFLKYFTFLVFPKSWSSCCDREAKLTALQRRILTLKKSSKASCALPLVVPGAIPPVPPPPPVPPEPTSSAPSLLLGKCSPVAGPQLDK